MAVMDREDWAALEPLLDRALDLAPADRGTLLDDLQASAPRLADALRSLLAAEATADRRGFLAEPPEMTLEGLQVGAYTLERQLGRGGMGSVWLARRTDGRFEGKAAVKLLNLSLLGASGQLRFRGEGSMLARLTHPAIARLLDAGVASSGQPYLVLEHVDGQPIDTYVEQRGLTTRECVRLFGQVLGAVGHAHANLIVHRDLKPSNILVTADGAVKLLDFGIATLLDAELTGERASSAVEDGRALTLEFAAPEQVRGEAVTTATDVYALGAVLYRLLSGRHPTGEGCTTTADFIRAVLEVEPARLGKGDLDDVLVKTLRKAPAERYQTVTALASDLESHLRHEPVSARPRSLGYRAGKFVRRNRAAVSAAAAAVLFASTYMVTLRRDRERVRLALAEATLGTRKAEQVTDFAVGLFEASGHRPGVADTVIAPELLERGIARARELSGQPALEAQMLDVIGRIHAERGEYPQARVLLEEALVIRRKALGDGHPDVATSLMGIGGVADLTENSAVAVRSFRQAFEIRRRAFGDGDSRTTDALYELAQVLHTSGDYDAARQSFDRWSAAIARQAPQVTPDRANQMNYLASILQFTGRLDQAERIARGALEIDRALYGERHHRIGMDLAKLGSILSDAGKHEPADTVLTSAVAALRASYPEGHVELANALRNLGLHLEETKRWADAEGVWREAAGMYRRAVGGDKVSVANATLHIGYSLSGSGRRDEGVAVIRDAIRMFESLLPASSPVVVRTYLYLGDALQAQGKYAEAESLLLPRYQALNQPSRFARAGRRFAGDALVRLYEAQGRSDEAAKYRGDGARVQPVPNAARP
jgi:eukaryotic-like serine/threonine-protein kinase